jgi:hypothetical protein
MGSVAKNGWGRKKLGPDSSLGGNREEALHESNLSANVAFPDSFNLPFSHHMHRLISTDGPPRRCSFSDQMPQFFIYFAEVDQLGLGLGKLLAAQDDLRTPTLTPSDARTVQTQQCASERPTDLLVSHYLGE